MPAPISTSNSGAQQLADLGRRFRARTAGSEDVDREGAWVAIYSSGVSSGRSGAGKPPDSGGKRGKIEGFSYASRRRMRRRLVQFDWDRLINEKRVLWATFTAREGTASDFKRWLDTWAKRFLRRNPRGWFVWRLEYQSRGVAHLHLLVVFPSSTARYADRKRCVLDWCDITGDTEDGQPNSLPHCQPMKTPKGIYGIASYISDASKATQSCPPDDEHPGRWWGIRCNWVGSGDTRRPVFADVLVRPTIVYGWDVYFEYRRWAGNLRRARYRVFDRDWRGPPGAVRDSVTFVAASHLGKLDRVFSGDCVSDYGFGDWVSLN